MADQDDDGFLWEDTIDEDLQRKVLETADEVEAQAKAAKGSTLTAAFEARVAQGKASKHRHGSDRGRQQRDHKRGEPRHRGSAGDGVHGRPKHRGQSRQGKLTVSGGAQPRHQAAPHHGSGEGRKHKGHRGAEPTDRSVRTTSVKAQGISTSVPVLSDSDSDGSAPAARAATSKPQVPRSTLSAEERAAMTPAQAAAAAMAAAADRMERFQAAQAKRGGKPARQGQPPRERRPRGGSRDDAHKPMDQRAYPVKAKKLPRTKAKGKAADKSPEKPKAASPPKPALNLKEMDTSVPIMSDSDSDSSDGGHNGSVGAGGGVGAGPSIAKAAEE